MKARRHRSSARRRPALSRWCSAVSPTTPPGCWPGCAHGPPPSSSSIRAAVGRVWDRVQAFARQVGTRLQQAAAAVLQVLSSLFSGLRQRLQAVLERLRAAANSAVDRLLQGVTRLTELARDGWEALKAGARAFLERVRAVANGVVERFKGMGRNAFGPMTGSCLDTPTAEATRSRLEGLAGPGEAEVGEAATTGLAGLTSQFSNRDAQGNAQLGGLESSASTSIAQTAQENDGLAAAADAGQIDLETRAGTSITDVANQATTDVGGAEREAESGAGDVDRQRTEGAGGLRGMLGSLVAAISGAAGSVVSGADHDAGEAAGGLRGRFSGLLGSLREVASSALAGLRTGVTQVIDGIKSFARGLAEQARALWQTLRDTWERLKERGRAAWAQLRQWWDQLSAKATSGWRSLRDFLTRTRNRAALALFNTCGDACALTSAKQEGRQLDAVEVPAISFKARRGGARQPAPSELVAIQASLEDGGQPIPASSRIGLEAAFGTDLDEHPGPHRGDGRQPGVGHERQGVHDRRRHRLRTRRVPARQPRGRRPHRPRGGPRPAAAQHVRRAGGGRGSRRGGSRARRRPGRRVRRRPHVGRDAVGRRRPRHQCRPPDPLGARPAPLPVRQVLRPEAGSRCAGAGVGTGQHRQPAGGEPDGRSARRRRGRRRLRADRTGVRERAARHDQREVVGEREVQPDVQAERRELPDVQPVAVLLRHRRPLRGLRLQPEHRRGRARAASPSPRPARARASRARGSPSSPTRWRPRSRRPRSSTPTTSPGRGT